MTDEQLYQQYLEGNEPAAATLVERYGDWLTLYINGYLSDPYESEDLMIEAFSRIFAKERPLVGEGAFRAYLYKVARNLVFRHKQKLKLFFLPLEELEFAPSSNQKIDTDLLRSEQNRQLYAALESLKPEYREAIYLVYFCRLSYHNAAQVMGKNEQQITNLVHRGKQRLKNLLEREGFDYAEQ